MQLLLVFVSARGHYGHASPDSIDGPCDILGTAGNPCVAAHSTVRALYANYHGPLYTVVHHATNRSTNISALRPGGFANAREHEELCPAVGDCFISHVMDQSGNGNHLTPRDDRGVPQKPGTPEVGHKHNPVDASRHKIHVGEDSTPVYAMYFDPGDGYNVRDTRGVAKGDEPETIFAVMTGKRFGNRCCFDYGNSEADDKGDGAGAMEAIFFGVSRWQGNTGYADPGCTLAPRSPFHGAPANVTETCDGATAQTSEKCCGPWYVHIMTSQHPPLAVKFVCFS